PFPKTLYERFLSKSSEHLSPYDSFLAVLRYIVFDKQSVINGAKELLGPEPNQYTGAYSKWAGYVRGLSGLERSINYEDFVKDAGGDGTAPSKEHVKWEDNISMVVDDWQCSAQMILESLSTNSRVKIQETSLVRKYDLKRALELKGLKLRPDSLKCQQYIKNGGNLSEVLDTMSEMHFLHERTSYQQIRRKEKQKRRDIEQSAHMDPLEEAAKQQALSKYIADGGDFNSIPLSLHRFLETEWGTEKIGKEAKIKQDAENETKYNVMEE
ncbi:hypothetical protein BKA69DRAFT_1127729, partial [Paraphysoderma sedebokerense]